MSLDPAIPLWPHFLAPQTISWGLTRPVMAGPQPLAGRPQSVMSDMGAWRVTLTNILLADVGDRIRAFRALFFGTLALGQPVYLPLYDWRRNPYRRYSKSLSAFPADARFGDGATFSDGSSYGGEPDQISVAVAAPARSTALIVKGKPLIVGGVMDGSTAPPLPEAGEFIGIGERAHMVVRSFPDTPVANQTTLQIQPPLRAAAAVDDFVAISNPLCRVKLDPKSVETMMTLDLSIVGNVSLDFYEDNWT